MIQKVNDMTMNTYTNRSKQVQKSPSFKGLAAIWSDGMNVIEFAGVYHSIAEAAKLKGLTVIDHGFNGGKLKAVPKPEAVKAKADYCYFQCADTVGANETLREIISEIIGKGTKAKAEFPDVASKPTISLNA